MLNFFFRLKIKNNAKNNKNLELEVMTFITSKNQQLLHAIRSDNSHVKNKSSTIASVLKSMTLRTFAMIVLRVVSAASRHILLHK